MVRRANPIAYLSSVKAAQQNLSSSGFLMMNPAYALLAAATRQATPVRAIGVADLLADGAAAISRRRDAMM